jgi:GcrA cell cycle regulator
MAVDFWNEERVDHLAQAWDEGNSAAEIAEELGCSRSAVIGKLSRLGLLEPAPRPPSAARARYERIVAAFDDRQDGCAWPIGDPSQPGFRFCGADRPYIDASYCHQHLAEAYVPRKRGTKISKSVRAPAAANANSVEELDRLVAA